LSQTQDIAKSFASQLSDPLPPRSAATALREQVARFLVRAGAEPGTRLGTESELVGLLKVSRSTVRRALDPLEAAGWIDRRAGAGTFVGSRVGQGDFLPLTRDGREPEALRQRAVAQGLLRLAILVFNIGDLTHDWYTPAVIEGIDEVAEELRISVELLGNRDRDVEMISRRLAITRPDVLAGLSNDPKQAHVVRDAQRLGIHCIVAGTPHASLGVPVVVEDNRQMISLAVNHLVEQGHRRIGLMIQRVVEPWVFERHEGFLAAIERAGIEADESLVHWLPLERPADESELAGRVERFIRSRGLTAVIPGNDLPMRCLDTLVRSERLSVPEDVSVVNLEQDYARRRWLNHGDPTSLIMPLKQMGRTLAQLARASAERRAVEPLTVLEAVLKPGSTVRRLR
jgi:DNA-binding LacI/PurR family transcriptional regulator/DNA-binding MarR family transcriptional regulator